jgi:hypothetical protein
MIFARGLVCAILIALTMPLTAQAALFFFGEDLSPTPGTPAGNIPNSIAARNGFASAVVGASAFVYTAETPFPGSPGPIAFNGPSGVLNATAFGDLATAPYPGTPLSISGTNVIFGTEGFSIQPTQNLIGLGIFGLTRPSAPNNTFVTPIRFTVEYLDNTEETFVASGMTLGLESPTIAFFGVIADQPFDRFTIRGTVTPSQDLLWDDITVIAAVPEPTSVALLLIAMLVLLSEYFRTKSLRQAPIRP